MADISFSYLFFNCLQ